MKRAIILISVLTIAIGGASMGLSLATPGSNFVGVAFGRGTFPSLHVDITNPRDIVVSEVSIAPGGYSGWHQHPGKVIVAVQRGALTLYHSDGSTCTKGKTYTAGQVFIERSRQGAHFARNESATTAAVINATFLNVPVGGSPFLDRPQPSNCPL